MTFRLIPLALAAAMCVSGCTSMAPKLELPDAPVPDQYSEPAAAGDKAPSADAGQTTTAAPVSVAGLDWNQYFSDQRLQSLIHLALVNNRDLKVAVLNVERAQAQYRIQRSDLLPQVSATATSTAQRIPGDLNSTGKVEVTHDYSVTGGVSWELDLFGRVQSLRDAALQQYLESDAAQKSARLSLISEVATSWYTLQADQQLLKLAQDTLDSQKSSFERNQRSYELGATSQLDLDRARVTVETARLSVATYTTQVAQDRNALRLLVGASVPEDLLSPTPLEKMPPLPTLEAGLPSQTLERRPDIAEAEASLRAANANIGAARAAFFPSISLTGNAGTASSELSGLFGHGQGTWSFTPTINVPIFTWGANEANLDTAKIDTQIAVANYEKAIQTAFQEVSDALAERASLDERLSAQQSLVDSYQRAYTLSEARYEAGADSYLSVLDAQRSLFSAQQALISERLTHFVNSATLYKVLGGSTESQVQVAGG